jgi:hypothetical protein
VINRVTLKQLYKDIFRRSALLAIPNCSELLDVPNNEFTKWEIFYSIVRDALKTYEYYYPLCLIQKAYIEVDSQSRKAFLIDNFKAYLKSIVDESQILVIPSAIVGISTSYYTASTYPMREFRYNPPEITDCWYSSNTYYMNTICKRPFIEEYEEVSGDPTDNCAVFYMSRDTDSMYTIFANEVYLQMCRYLLNIKKNMNLQNMPIDLFNGLEEDFQRMQSDQQNIYSQAMPSAYWIL